MNAKQGMFALNGDNNVTILMVLMCANARMDSPEWPAPTAPVSLGAAEDTNQVTQAIYSKYSNRKSCVSVSDDI